MSRVISPPKNELDSLRTPLNQGEIRVLEYFDSCLPEEWEIYIQPHLNGVRPDFVLLNPNVGIGIFEVKDWNLQALDYRVKWNVHGRPQLWGRDRGGKEFIITDEPVCKAHTYKDKIFKVYAPLLGLECLEYKKKYAIVTAGVIFTAAPTNAVKQLLKPIVEYMNMNIADYYPVVGSDMLQPEFIDKVFPAARWNSSKIMKPEYAKELRYWLVEPDHSVSQRRPLQLDERQRQLATTRTESGFRRIKGPAGSGKSLVLAARAAQLTTEGKKVLVVTFNITLWHYLRDLATRYPEKGKRVVGNITWTHFHGWAADICSRAGMSDEYNQLMSTMREEQEDSCPAKEDVFEYMIPKLVQQSLNRLEESEGLGEIEYDAVMVDEGQDYNLEWWNLLRRVCVKGGEMLLVADRAQDMYSRAKRWTEDSMRGAGFYGDWVQLKECYRVHPELAKYLNVYAKTYLPQYIEEIPVPAPSLLDACYPIQLKWIQIKSFVSAENVAVQELMGFMDGENKLAAADLTLLLPTHKVGLHCVRLLNNKNIDVAHVFGESNVKSKLQKISFYMGDSRLKAATVHSFKGWESRAMVVYVDSCADESSKISVHVALTRLKCNSDGSYLTVVCREPSLCEYGKQWPQYEEV